jgi:hypothetical protein
MFAFGMLPGLGSAAYGVELPVGSVIAFAGDATSAAWQTQHPNWLICDGSTRKIADYPELYYALGAGTIYDSGGGPEFTLPNYGAMFLRGVVTPNSSPPYQDTDPRCKPPGSAGTPTGVGSTQEDMVQLHQHDYD